MTIPPDHVDAGVDRLLSLCLADPPLARELAASREEFFPAGGSAPGTALAERRHLEWFLFERPSDHLGGVPAEVLLERVEASGLEPEPFLSSRAGVFEVTSVEPERGLWLHDLFGHGEYPIEEPGLGNAIAPGDLMVGRIFPVGDALFRLSPAAALFRDPELASALKRDVEGLRAGRRGTLRIAQAELERMFFSGGAYAAPADPASARATARERLVEGGAEPALVDRLIEELREAARAGRPAALTEMLNRLAFDTDVELEAARGALLDLWSAWTDADAQARARGVEPAARGRARAAGDAAAPREAIADALARFDQGREQGRDLEQLFRALEDDLGLDPGEGEDVGEAPDFPGVVTAVVTEFLWDVERADGADVARRFQPLLLLGEFATPIGVIDNLSADHLREFAARWVLDRGVLTTAEEAIDLVEALAAFGRWCEETQDLPLRARLDPVLAGLRRSLPRIVEIRRRFALRRIDGAATYRFARSPEGAPLLVEPGGEAREVRLPEALAHLLREGDVVEARLQPDGGATLGACYPPELVPKPDA